MNERTSQPPTSVAFIPSGWGSFKESTFDYNTFGSKGGLFFLVVFCEKEIYRVDNVRSHQKTSYTPTTRISKKNEVETCCHRYLRLKQNRGHPLQTRERCRFTLTTKLLHYSIFKPAHRAIIMETIHITVLYIGNINIYLFYAMDRIISIFSSSIIDSEIRSLL